MDADVGQLRELAANLRRLDAVGVEIAEASKAEVLAIARETTAAGQSPDGEAWIPTKDGRRPLKGAAAAITAVVSGTSKAVLTLVLSGFYVFHHHARGKRVPRRPMLFNPADGVPPKMAAVIEKNAQRIVARTLGGR